MRWQLGQVSMELARAVTGPAPAAILDGRDAVLAPEDGAVVVVSDAPGGRYTVPSRGDCVACP